MKDFLVAIWRSAVRERSYALINLVGLALGFACCMVLALFLRSELTYDRHFDKHARIYRLGAEIITGSESRLTAWAPRAGAPMMANDNPQIEAHVRFTDSSLQDGLRLHHDGKVLNWRETYFASDSVFKVFSHNVLEGDPGTALADPSTVAISATLARAYFGGASALGKLLRTDAGESWKVTLVFHDLPSNTHLRYDALFSDKIPLLRDAANQSALQAQLTRGFAAYTYLLMRPGFDRAEWDRFSKAFVDRYIAADAARFGQKLRVILQPLASIHYADPLDGEPSTGNRFYLYGCVSVALFILFVACINYTNLATARALRRSRAVAIRKILGATQGRLLLECLGEAVLYALAAAILGLAIAELALTLTPMGELLGQRVQLDISSDLALLGGVLGAAAFIGLLAGAYPAVYLSAWMPVAAFTSRGGGSASGARLREVLVLLQFVMAVAVIGVTLVMAAQMRYVDRLPLGFDRENQLMVTIRGTANFLRVPALAQELQRHPEVLAVTQSAVPPGRFDSTGFMMLEGDNGAMESRRVAYSEADANFPAALGIQIMAGKALSPDSPPGLLLVNQSLVRSMGWQDPVGKRIGEGRVVGVMRDFHYRSLRDPIEPLVLERFNDDPSRVPEAQRPFVQRTVIIRVSGRDFPGTIRHIEETLRRFDPGNPFEYTLLDETLHGAYATERRMLALIAIFASLCILIACLGLSGLTAFATERRAREIAVRKVLGASASQVVWMLSRRVLLLIGVGGLIAAAIAWIVMNEWLSAFAYRVGVHPLLLATAITLAGGVALGTVALQARRVARADPADMLRHD